MIILRTLSLSLSKKKLSKVGIYQFLLISLHDIDIYCIYWNTLFLHPQLQLRLPSSDCSKSNETEWLSSWHACNTCKHPSGAYKLRNELVYGMFYGKRNFRQSICRSTGRSWDGHQHLNESCVQGPHYQWSSLLSTLWLELALVLHL